ncbi:hypothetical protein V6X62_01360 [Spiribacter sp. 218]|uniref:hypothetical protein n=1 Tax=Spiribacter pallidus TaxID=1987936 RepID=UPI00349F7B3E
MKDIFLINNNITLLVALLTIDHLGLSENQVIIVASRNTSIPVYKNLKVINLPQLARWQAIKSHYIDSGPFRLFMPHDSVMRPVGKNLMSSRYCQGISYLEEGALAYKDYPMRVSSTARNLSKVPFVGKYFKYWLSVPWFSKENANVYHFFDGAFPWAKRENRIAVRNIDALIPHYRRCLSAGAIVLLVSKIEDIHISLSTIKLVDLPEEAGPIFLKPHPDLLRCEEELRYVCSDSDLKDMGVSILDASCILELEMMVNKIFVLGHKETSLRRYVKALGSVFIPFSEDQLKLFSEEVSRS